MVLVMMVGRSYQGNVIVMTCVKTYTYRGSANFNSNHIARATLLCYFLFVVSAVVVKFQLKIIHVRKLTELSV